MIMSMTGYGRGEARAGHFAVALELKTLNHRHFEAVIKLPGGLWELEKNIQTNLRKVIHRGRVEVYLHLLTPVAGMHEPLVDSDLAAKYLATLRRSGKHLGLKSIQPDLALLTRLPGVMRVEERPIKTKLIGRLVNKAQQQALKRLMDMRRLEGRKLLFDIRQRWQQLKHSLKTISKIYQKSLDRQEQYLQQRIIQWLKVDAPEGKRLAQEAFLKYLRSDITEELVRLESHIAQFAHYLSRPEPVGRQLDFLIQEMNREINTVGAKAVTANISHLVVTAKEELEKIREQIQNVE